MFIYEAHNVSASNSTSLQPLRTYCNSLPNFDTIALCAAELSIGPFVRESVLYYVKLIELDPYCLQHK